MRRRQLVKFGVSLGFSALASTSLLGCSSQKEKKANAIKMGVTSRPRMLDPRLATDALSSRVNRLLYAQLIDFNEAFEPVPDLAAWQKISEQHYRFTLVKKSVFHTEQPTVLTAFDVEATYRSVLDSNFGSPHKGSLKGVLKVKAINENQVDFYLKQPDALFVGRLVIGILPKSLIQAKHDFKALPIGSGACQFVSNSTQKLVIQRQDGVQIQFIPVKEATVRVLKLRKGELDIIQNDLSPELVQYCQQNKQLKVKWHHGTSFGYIGLNFEDPLLKQLPMRQALAYGIDRQAIINALFNGHARLATELLVPEHWAGNKTLKPMTYQPEKAKKLLKMVKKPPGLVNSAGLIELSYKTSSDPTRLRLATIYQAQLKKIGIQLNIQSYDWGTFYSDIKKGRFQLYSLAWVGVKSPDIFQYVFDSHAIPPNGANRGRYRDAKVDALIAEASRAQSVAKQAQLYQQLQSRLYDTLASLPLWYEDQYAVMNRKIVGYELYADGRYDGLLKVQFTHKKN